MRVRRNWLSPSAAITVVRSGTGGGFLSLPGKVVPHWLQLAWLTVMWHHRLAWHMPPGRVLTAGSEGVLAFQGKTATGRRAWVYLANSLIAVATLMSLYLVIALAVGAVPLVLIPWLGLTESLRSWWPAYTLIYTAGTILVALFVMTRPMSASFRRDVLLTGLVGDVGWRVLVLGVKRTAPEGIERMLLDDLVTRAYEAPEIRRLIVDSRVLSSPQSLPPNCFTSHNVEGEVIYAADGLIDPALSRVDD